MKRRDFLQKTLFAFGAAAASPYLKAADKLLPTASLLILHTNDIHSRIDPFPVGSGAVTGKGGLSRLAKMIEQLRQEHPQVLLLDAGDVFQGTPYFNYFQGQLEFQLLSKMGYDAGTIGNHDFDGGVEGLDKALDFAGFPLVNANYDFTASALDGKILPYQILQKGKIKIGIVGAGIRLKGLVADAMCEGVTYHEPTDIVDNLAKELKAKGCHLVICLSHLGFEYKNKSALDDIELAKKTKHIDLIIGGHTHTFLDHPIFVRNKAEKAVLIHQVGWAGLRLGYLPLKVDLNNRQLFWEVETATEGEFLY